MLPEAPIGGAMVGMAANLLVPTRLAVIGQSERDRACPVRLGTSYPPNILRNTEMSVVNSFETDWWVGYRGIWPICA